MFKPNGMYVKFARDKWGGGGGSSTFLSPICREEGVKKISDKTEGGHKNFDDSNKNVPDPPT